MDILEFEVIVVGSIGIDMAKFKTQLIPHIQL